MAQAVPLISAGIAAGGLYQSYRQGKKADSAASKAEKGQKKIQKETFDKQNVDLKKEQKELGTRRRIASLAKGGSGTLFSSGSFAGAPAAGTLG